MTEQITVNGIDLASYAVMLPSMSGMMTTPARRGENIAVPGRHGRVAVRRKRYEQGEFVLNLWVLGCLPDGSIPASSNALRQFELRRDELLRAFHADTVTVDVTPDSGVTRRALCEVADVMDFTRVGVEPIARVSVALTIPGAFWTELTTRTHAASLSNAGATSATPFAGATAPMDELIITFGAGSNPELSQGSTYFAYDGVIPAGAGGLVVNTATWTATLNGAPADMSKIRHGGAPRFFEVYPQDPAPVFSLAHTGGGSMSVTVEGKRKFLTP